MTQGGFDVYVEHSGDKQGYNVAPADGGGLAYEDGLAPELSPQIQQGNYSYGHIPPQVAVIRAWEDFHQGAGYENAGDQNDTEKHASHRYNYSQGVDASWPERLYISPALQALLESDATAIGAAPAFYSRTADGVFLAGGQYIYEYDSGGWLQRRSVAGTITGPIVDFNGTEFAPYGDSTAYAYSADGVTWTTVAAPLADLYAAHFVVRGQSSGAAVLWKITSTGALKNNTSGESGGAAWSAATQIGSSGYTVGGMVVANNNIVVTKTDGIYTYDGTTVSKVWDGGRLMYHSTNGSNPTVFSNGNIYVPYGDRLLEYDDVGTTVRFVWPDTDAVGNAQVNGNITAVAADVTHIYFALKNAAGNTYIMKGRPDEGWHTWAYLGANNCNALLVAGAGDVHASNPVLLIGYGTAGDYFILPRSGMLPENDSNYRFNSSGGFIIGPWDDVNSRGFTKFLNSGTVLVRSAGVGKTATLAYEADSSGDVVDILTAESNGKADKAVTAEVEFNRLRYKLTLTTTGATTSPVVESIVLSNTLNNPRKRLWKMSLIVASDVAPIGGGDARSSAKKLRDHLFDGKNKRINFYDIYGTKYRARILDINGSVRRRDTKTLQQAVSVTLVEV